MRIEIPIHILPGELADRRGIAALRVGHLPQGPKRELALAELAKLDELWRSLPAGDSALPKLVKELDQINARLWDVEDRIRACEAKSDFGAAFILLARSVYQINDRRADLKRRINQAFHCHAGDDKVYSTRPLNPP
jgi:hypothetical protein